MELIAIIIVFIVAKILVANEEARKLNRKKYDPSWSGSVGTEPWKILNDPKLHTGDMSPEELEDLNKRYAAAIKAEQEAREEYLKCHPNIKM